jgi:putative heme-binding domain-containing protein
VQQIAYAYGLRTAQAGWTPELRRTFFSWFSQTVRWQGGNQFRGFLDQIRADALTRVPDAAERKTLEALSKFEPPAVAENVKPPVGPGRNYTTDDILAFAKDGLHRRNYARGRELFRAAACLNCHRFGNEGGGVGPDLTGSGSRYTLRDLIENLIEPSKVISDQYESSILTLKDGTTVTGRVTAEETGKLLVAANAFAPGDTTEVKLTDLKSRKPSPVSLMPEGLLNGMNPSEVLDLLAFLLSAGDPKSAVFR